MIIQIDMSLDIPIYEQLRNEIVKGIGRGEFEDGECLPTVRQLASDLGVNNMTVSRAYQLLKAEGLIETDRRRGAVVRLPESMRRAGEEGSDGGRKDFGYHDRKFLERMEGDLELLSAEAKIRGLDREEFVRMCEAAFAGMEG